MRIRKKVPKAAKKSAMSKRKVKTKVCYKR